MRQSGSEPKKRCLFSVSASYHFVNRTLRFLSFLRLLGLTQTLMGGGVHLHRERTVHSSWFNWIENAFCFPESIDHYERIIDVVPKDIHSVSYNHTRTETLSKSWFFLVKATVWSFPQPREKNDTETLNFKVSCTDKYI